MTSLSDFFGRLHATVSKYNLPSPKMQEQYIKQTKQPIVPGSPLLSNFESLEVPPPGAPDDED